MSASQALDDLGALLRSPPGSTEALYDRLAPSYERFRELWISLAGGRAEEAMLEDVGEIVEPEARVLDAGSGSGAISRKLLELEPSVELTMLDASQQMLEGAADLPGRRVQGDVCEIPFDDGSFDLVVCAWVIETLPDPLRAATEMLRVLDPDGHLIFTFTSLPGGWLSRPGTKLLREILESRFAGRALPDQHIPWHDCGRSHRRRFAGGLTEEIVLRKCCSVPASLAGAAAGAG